MEESRLGLIIVEAYYGCFVTDERYIWDVCKPSI